MCWECWGHLEAKVWGGLRVGEGDGEGVEEGFPGVGDKNRRGL